MGFLSTSSVRSLFVQSGFQSDLRFNFCSGPKLETKQCNYMPCGCPTDTKCECSFTKNAAGKTLKKFDCSMKGITSLKGMEIWKDAEYFDLSINKVWSGQEVYDLGKLKIIGIYFERLLKRLSKLSMFSLKSLLQSDQTNLNFRLKFFNIKKFHKCPI